MISFAQILTFMTVGSGGERIIKDFGLASIRRVSAGP